MKHSSIRSVLALATALLVSQSVSSAQVRYGGEPAALRAPELAPAPVLSFVVPPSLYKEDEPAEGASTRLAGPRRFGVPVPVAADSDRHGVWDLTADGDLVWRLEVHSPGAKSLGLGFAEFQVPAGGQVFLYDPSLSVVYGAYDHRNHQPSGGFAIEPFPGDTVLLEYRHPAGAGQAGRLALSHVVYDYADYFAVTGDPNPLTGSGGGGGGTSGGCTVNASCSVGNPYSVQKRATVRTTDLGSICTAVLLNNTAQDGTPYLYTPFSCGQGSLAIVHFNVDAPTCGGTAVPLGQSVTGVSHVSAQVATDGRLVRLNQSIPASYQPYFAGWDRSVPPPTRTVTFYHPDNQPKAIAIDNQTALVGVYPVSGFGNVHAFQVVFDVGGAPLNESAGGPLFDQNGRVRGSLSFGVQLNCVQRWFGRLNYFWNNSSLPAFLDPLGSGVLTLDGYDPNAKPVVPTITEVSPSTLPAVTVDGTASVTLTGTTLAGATGVTVDGVPLSTFPAQFQVVSDTQVDIIVFPAVASLGPVEIVVEHPLGDTVAQVEVVANDPPALEVAFSEPAFVFTLNGLDVTLGSDAGDLAFLSISGDLSPSSLPGFVDWAIGGDFTSLFSLGTFAMEADGRVDLNLPPDGSLAGFSLHLQAAVLDVSELPAIWPLLMTNAQTVNVLI